MKKLVDELDDFIGNQTKDLTKPLQIMGINDDIMGARVIEDIMRKQPLYVDVIPMHAVPKRVPRRR